MISVGSIRLFKSSTTGPVFTFCNGLKICEISSESWKIHLLENAPSPKRTSELNPITQQQRVSSWCRGNGVNNWTENTPKNNQITLIIGAFMDEWRRWNEFLNPNMPRLNVVCVIHFLNFKTCRNWLKLAKSLQHLCVCAVCVWVHVHEC